MTTQQPTQHTELIDLLTAVWQDVLGVHDITPDEDFFDLGGDSMAATAITAAIRAHTGRQIPVRMIFDNPTVAELAHAVGRERA
ncbi:acyl carrier protein [Streptomyces sp. NPDC126514]|uniref:acyl carrier protein n=1 Tax=Streptomyces sp. NPDC126514 TaxID=3155210 RepID=UPI00331F2FA0